MSQSRSGFRLSLPRATHAPGEPVRLHVAGAPEPEAYVQVWHLADEVLRLPAATGTLDLGPLPVGGYGAELWQRGQLLASAAFDVLETPFERPRYGFVSHYEPERDAEAVAAHFRALGLNLCQFYDWGYRHAQLVTDEPEYVDPLGRPIALATVRALTGALRAAGVRSLGYAAVYAVGAEAWPQWRQAGLFHADGSPWRLGEDFLLIVDPGEPSWQAHLSGQLREAIARDGFDGFHLDQYGAPKRALRADGSGCELEDAFADLLERLRAELPTADLVFNNVNDFPTWLTGSCRQDAAYVEVWEPHASLGQLGRLVARTRGWRSGQPPIMAAYLSVYRDTPAALADPAAALAMATIFSHGGTHLLNGEDGALLTHPYYPDHHRPGGETAGLMERWYAFLVRFGDLLLARELVDVTMSYTGGINEEIRLVADGDAAVSVEAEAESLWVRVVRAPSGLLVHVINLLDQQDTRWDAAKNPVTPLPGVRLQVQRTSAEGTRALVASPDGSGRLEPAPVRAAGDYDEVELPALGTWTMIYLPAGR